MEKEDGINKYMPKNCPKKGEDVSGSMP